MQPERLPFALCSPPAPHPVLEQEGPPEENPQWQNGYRWLSSQPPEEAMFGKWEAGSSMVTDSEEKEKEEEKYQQEVVFGFHAQARRCPLAHHQ